jgi:hypothetical protein
LLPKIISLVVIVDTEDEEIGLDEVIGVELVRK